MSATAGNDALTLLGFDSVDGLAGADRLSGGLDTLAYTILGSDGNDSLTGNNQADSLDGGGDLDLLSYAGATAGVTLDIGTGLGSSLPTPLPFDGLLRFIG